MQDCSERQRLLEAYGQAVQAFYDTAQTYRNSFGYKGSEEVWQFVNSAQIAATAARIALDVHTAEHGCKADS
jgi:hypothetical protein